MRFDFPFAAMILVGFASISGCSAVVPDPTPAPTPAPAPAPAPAPPPPAPAPQQPQGDWTEWPIENGSWVYRQDARGSIALFGPANSEATFMIRCDRARGEIYLSRQGTIASTGASMTLRASSGLKSFAARNSGGALNYAAVMLAPDEYLLDRIAYSRGRFAVEVGGLRSVAIPIWPEFTRVVEDCRR